MTRYSVVVVLLSVAPAASHAASSTPALWVQAVPEDAGETALKEALSRGGFAGPAPTIDALRSVSDRNPGTLVSGLARLAAGLSLLDLNRASEAIAQLKHPDVARTELTDHAFLALGRAQETAGDLLGAAQSYEQASAFDHGPIRCPALFRAVEARVRAAQPDRALGHLHRALNTCPGQEARALLRLAQVHEALRDFRSAAVAYDRLDHDYPASPQARDGVRRLQALSTQLPSTPPAERLERDIKKALALFEVERPKEAAALLQSLQGRGLSGDNADLVRVRLGQALLLLGRRREGQVQLTAVQRSSPYGAEAAFHLARDAARRQSGVGGYQAVASTFPGSPWAEEALLLLANHYQKDARDDDALPYWRRLQAEFPDGRYADRATWRVAWGDYRKGRFEDAAQVLERAVRSRPQTTATAGFLYWAGRARRELGQIDRARPLLEETIRRFKNAYHGIRAREALAQLPAGSPTPPPSPAAQAQAFASPPPTTGRIRQLLLIGRMDEAYDELMSLPPSPTVQATLAWIESRRGRLRPAITAMKRAHPEYVSEAGDRLPDEVWRIIYPLEFGDVLQSTAGSEGLDPALVAALVCQESTFDAGAVSRVGARGLMQVMGATGRILARTLGVKYQKKALHEPRTSLEFGMRYLRQMVDRFGGRVERALAAYNAGPHRVDAWTAGRPDMSAEEFIESIPFTETRQYVMIILANQVQYRRIYSLHAVPRTVGPGTTAP